MDILWLYLGSSELVIGCAVVFLLLLCHSLFGPLFYWWRRGVPCIFAIPLFGSMIDSVLQIVFIGEIYMRMYQKLEGKRYGGFLKFSKPAIIVRDPKIIKIILETSFPSFHDNDLALSEDVEPMFSRNLFVVTGERWKRLRSHLSPAFTPGKIKALYPLVEEVCHNLHIFLDSVAGTELDLKDLFARFTTEVVSSCAFGIHSDAIHVPNSEFRQMAHEMLNPSPLRAAYLMVLLQFPSILRFIPLSLFPDNVTKFFRRLVREVVTQRERENIQRSDFMALLIQLKKEGKLGINLAEQGSGTSVGGDEHTKQKGSTFVWDSESIDDIAAQALGFFIDGSETSSVVMSFALFELAHHPEIQHKLRADIKEVKLKYGGNLSYDGLQEISYLEMVILETLRKYPPASFMARLTTKQHKFPSPEINPSQSEEGKEVLVEVDTPVVIPVLAIHRDPKYYPDPDVFDPDRFSEAERQRRDRFTFLPFGEGPRVCIGRRFGMMQTKAAIATVLLSYELMPSDQTLMPITFDQVQFLTSSKNHLYVYVRKIKS